MSGSRWTVGIGVEVDSGGRERCVARWSGRGSCITHLRAVGLNDADLPDIPGQSVATMHAKCAHTLRPRFDSVRMGDRMTTARWRDVEYELVDFTRGPPPQWVLRDETGDVLEMDIEDVEVKCERCGRWSAQAAPLPASVSAVADPRWVCHDGGCYDIEVASGASG